MERMRPVAVFDVLSDAQRIMLGSPRMLLAP